MLLVFVSFWARLGWSGWSFGQLLESLGFFCGFVGHSLGCFWALMAALGCVWVASGPFLGCSGLLLGGSGLCWAALGLLDVWMEVCISGRLLDL